MHLPFSRSPLQVCAVEDRSIQITWGQLPAGPVTVWSNDRHATVEHEGGPGSLDLDGLIPDTDHRIDVSWDGGRAQLSQRTLTTPPGEALCRIATISDLHLGSTNWGASKLMLDRSGHDTPFAIRCARAALSEAMAWGADLLIVKGDAAHHQDSEHFRLVGELLDETGDIPVLLIPGNHDVDGRGNSPVPAKVGDRGIAYIRGAASEDLPGLRVIAADTTIPGKGIGSIDTVREEVLELASVGHGPFLLGLHHQLQAHTIPTHYPPGIAAPSSTKFLDDLSRANPRGVVTSGHTHRNRARSHGPLRVTEVASTRDWPGVWAGYAVHEGGIRQVVRRTAAREAITWHEYSRKALFGLWEPWSIGPLGQRCFTHQWP